jgi:hypothetical protein
MDSCFPLFSCQPQPVWYQDYPQAAVTVIEEGSKKKKASIRERRKRGALQF